MPETLIQMGIGLLMAAGFLGVIFLVILLFPHPKKRNNNDPDRN